MLTTFIQFTLPLAFSLLVVCVITCLVSGLILVFLRRRAINEALRHPYLDLQAWERYPFPMRLAITLDYFLRLNFPNSTFWIAGNANRLLSHVEPNKIPTRIKWPLLGFWGGCFMGIAAMILLWIFIFLKMA